MRILSVAAVTVAVLVAGLILRSVQHATALPPTQTSTTIDPNALQLMIDVKSLPEQDTGDPI
jgi:hypothetical protein